MRIIVTRSWSNVGQPLVVTKNVVFFRNFEFSFTIFLFHFFDLFISFSEIVLTYPRDGLRSFRVVNFIYKGIFFGNIQFFNIFRLGLRPVVHYIVMDRSWDIFLVYSKNIIQETSSSCKVLL